MQICESDYDVKYNMKYGMIETRALSNPYLSSENGVFRGGRSELADQKPQSLHQIYVYIYIRK